MAGSEPLHKRLLIASNIQHPAPVVNRGRTCQSRQTSIELQCVGCRLISPPLAVAPAPLHIPHFPLEALMHHVSEENDVKCRTGNVHTS